MVGGSDADLAREVAATWAAALGCEPTPTAGNEWLWRTERWRRCARGGEVACAVVPGHGHDWPGGRTPLPERLIGPTAATTPATDAIWAFFANHRR